MSPTTAQLQRFFEKIAYEGDCWLWSASRDACGYGLIMSAGKLWRAHRFSFVYHKGPVPDGLEIDHLCGNRACVNPDHLEAVTHKENVLRGRSFGAENAKKTKCVNGHPFDEKNTAIWRGPKVTMRQCRTCHAACYTAKNLLRKERLIMNRAVNLWR